MKRKERKMNQTIWKQTDSRWAKKAYPKGSTVGGCGCGLLACTHVAMEQESKKNWTPDNLRAWMVGKGFALKGQGTKWEGITETLKYIGHKSVVRIYSDPMSEAWKELNKGNRIGVLLFNSRKAPNGTKWTASGHYVAFTDYKVQGGKHYFYTKDSGGRNHSGWYTYENSMKGCIAKVWIVERVGTQTNGSATAPKTETVTATTYKPTSAYSGSLPTSIVKNGSKGASVKAVQNFLNWCINAKLSVDSIAGAKTVSAIKVYQKTYGLTVDGIFGSGSKAKAQSIINQYKPKTTNAQKIVAKAKAYAWAYGTAEKKWAYKTGAATSSYKSALKTYMKHTTKIAQSDCGYFITTCVRASGVSSSFLALKGAKESFPSVPSSMSIVWKGAKIPSGTLKAGDIVRYKKTSGSQHTLMYIGDSKIAEAGRKIRFPRIAKDTKKYNASGVKFSTIQVIRAK